LSDDYESGFGIDAWIGFSNVFWSGCENALCQAHLVVRARCDLGCQTFFWQQHHPL